MITDGARTLRSGFLRTVQRHPARPAVEVSGQTVTYAELFRHAASLAVTLRHHVPRQEPPLVAVMAHRSVTAYAGVLGALLRGHGYVPLHPEFPAERSRQMLLRAGCRALVVDASGEMALDEVLQRVDHPLVVILPDRDDVRELAGKWPRHTVLGKADLAPAERWEAAPVDPTGIAYLLFTSGSTGTPKGVMVSHQNATRFIEVVVDRYAINERDRLSQIFELVFDLSVFDMFAAWECGGCVCCPSKQDLLIPRQFIHESQITIWFSVPSTATLMKKLGMLSANEYPHLRLSLFCGEALPQEIAQAWSAAAPNSVVENLYGPTEVTLCCTVYRWENERSPAECENRIVPIGQPLPRMKALVVDSELREVPAGQAGELLMAGPQVALGYWQDPEKTAKAFVVPPGKSEVYYRTGDQVRRPIGQQPLTFLGRLDQQVQIHGYRVELGEVEAAICDVARVQTAVAVGWPVNASGVDGVVAFLETESADVDQIKRKLKKRLPLYMVPRQIRLVAKFPLNSNGKIDRKALARTLDEAPCLIAK
jgi:amino acid adenylation domain-containing protein